MQDGLSYKPCLLTNLAPLFEEDLTFLNFDLYNYRSKNEDHAVMEPRTGEWWSSTRSSDKYQVKSSYVLCELS